MRLPKPLGRREALRVAAVGTLALPLLKNSQLYAAGAAAPVAAAGKPERLRLGVATYSIHTMSIDDTLATLKALRITNVALFKSHLDWETATPDEARAVAARFHAAAISITGSGVINLKKNEAACRKAFENAKVAQLATMVCKPDLDALPLVEKLAKEYDQRLAIHNHGPEDKVYPSPYDVMKAIAPFDARIGLCLDVGHAMRAKADPAEVIARCASRLFDLHMKDSLAAPGAEKDIPVEIGAGRMDVRAILSALLGIKYAGVVSFEYEKPVANPAAGLAESIGYVRGVLSTLRG